MGDLQESILSTSTCNLYVSGERLAILAEFALEQIPVEEVTKNADDAAPHLVAFKIIKISNLKPKQPAWSRENSVSR